jgi:predicted NUDIX family phosphoesterase
MRIEDEVQGENFITGATFMDKMNELVFAIKVEDLSPHEPIFQGFLKSPNQYILDRVYSKSVLMTRRECENNPVFKHIIPYTVITSEDNQIFVTRRTDNQTEKRLHDKASIGIGGHVGLVRYMGTKDSIHMGMIRELREEVTGMEVVGDSFDFTPHLMGFINSSDDVGLVHFGFVYELLVDPDRINSINVKETENMIGEWMFFEDALKVQNYELWSQYILEEMSKR